MTFLVSKIASKEIVTDLQLNANDFSLKQNAEKVPLQDFYLKNYKLTNGGSVFGILVFRSENLTGDSPVTMSLKINEGKPLQVSLPMKRIFSPVGGK